MSPELRLPTLRHRLARAMRVQLPASGVACSLVTATYLDTCRTHAESDASREQANHRSQRVQIFCAEHAEPAPAPTGSLGFVERTPRERPGALRARRSRVVISSGSCAPGWAEKKTSTRYGSHRSQVTLWRFPALGLHVRRHQPSTQENAVRSFNGPDLPSLRKATHGPCMPSSLA